LKYIVTVGEKNYEVETVGDPSKIRVDGREVSVDYLNIRGGKLHSLLADNTIFEFDIVRSNGGFDLWHGSRMVRTTVVDEKTDRFRKLMGATSAGVKASSLRAPMPGLILKVEVEPGQHVKKGDGLVIVEAMKMENELRAHAPAIVKEIRVKPGQAVEKNQELVIFE
jgi:pyruvate carboxylase subunit B